MFTALLLAGVLAADPAPTRPAVRFTVSPMPVEPKDEPIRPAAFFAPPVAPPDPLTVVPQTVDPPTEKKEDEAKDDATPPETKYFLQKLLDGTRAGCFLESR